MTGSLHRPRVDHLIAGDDHKVEQPGIDKGESTFLLNTLKEVVCLTDRIIQCVCECFCGIDEQLCTSLFLPFDF